MTGRTHDLAAFTALNMVIVSSPMVHVTFGTALVAFAANMIGGLAPDIDQPTADLWRRIPAGTVFSRFFTPFLGGHRFLSHSIVGIFIFGFIAKFLLGATSSFLLVDQTIVWWAFMIGFISHLIMDTFTRDGVPWLFPLPLHIGIPPFKILRLKTGGMLEKSVVFPGLLLLNVYLFYMYHSVLLKFIHAFS